MAAANNTILLMGPILLGLAAAILGGIFFFLGMRERNRTQAENSRRGRNYILLGGILTAAGIATCAMGFAFVTLMKIVGG